MKSGKIEFDVTSNYEFLNLLSSDLLAIIGIEFTMNKCAYKSCFSYTGNLKYQRHVTPQ
jgi:hypothetical protein